MKKIIRLTESDLLRIVKRIVSEQIPMGALAQPNTELVVTPINQSNDSICKVSKEPKELVLELFKVARKQTGKPGIKDTKIIDWGKRLNTSITGLGTSNDIYKVFGEINNLAQLGSVLDYYQTTYKTTFYSDLSGELTVTWRSIWKTISKLNKEAKISVCKTSQVSLAA